MSDEVSDNCVQCNFVQQYLSKVSSNLERVGAIKIAQEIIYWKYYFYDSQNFPGTYSCNNMTTTLIQISHLFYFVFFFKTYHQMII